MAELFKKRTDGGVIRFRPVITAVVFLAGAAFMVAGIIAGEPVSVMKKAVLICLECIGIG
jgi:hypothetical protein